MLMEGELVPPLKQETHEFSGPEREHEQHTQKIGLKVSVYCGGINGQNTR